MTATLDVYLGEALAGKLWRIRSKRSFRRDKLRFVYVPEWLKHRHFISLSVTLPRRRDAFDDSVVRPFFANLLPEAEMREAIATRRGECPDDVFGLLEELGADCAGAVSIWPLGQRPLSRHAYERISSARLKEAITRGKKEPLLLLADAVRISIAGSQDKLPLCHKAGAFTLPEGLSASTHILKPPSERHPHLPLNEFFCMRFAEGLGIDVCRSRLLRTPNLIYLADRFDRRQRRAGSTVSLHQIDFCQALNVMPEEKYEKDGGPSLKACFGVIQRHSSESRRDKLRLMSWVILNYLIANADTHAKNLSLMLTPTRTRLSPFYDLVCTRVYRDYPDELVMRIGGEKDPRNLRRRHWETLSHEARLPYDDTSQITNRLLHRLPDALATAKDAAAVKTRAEADLLNRIETTIRERGALLSRMEL